MKRFIYPVTALTILLGATFFFPLKGAPRSAVIVTDTAATSFPAFRDTFEVKIGETETYYGDSYIINLEPKKKKGRYVLPVVIGSWEFAAINQQLNEMPPPRPMAYDLMTSLVSKTGMNVRSVVIIKLEDNVFYALVLIDNKGQKLAIDSRPSDAINIALRSKAPIYVERDVFDAAKEEKTKK
ncbi:MAG TPA: bifunctional nuclease family protein [Bacteroidia bacterium]|nr:bifunctional nuclease family protein [Bacteroidia bacterium]